MAKYWIEYTDSFQPSPLSYWIYKPLDNVAWLHSSRFEPDLPKKDSLNGYKIYKIEHKGHELFFISVFEIEYCISILEQKVLPTTFELAEKSWMKGYQHLHWLTKWPADIKSYKDRLAIIKLLEKVKNL